MVPRRENLLVFKKKPNLPELRIFPLRLWESWLLCDLYRPPDKNCLPSYLSESFSNQFAGGVDRFLSRETTGKSFARKGCFSGRGWFVERNRSRMQWKKYVIHGNGQTPGSSLKNFRLRRWVSLFLSWPRWSKTSRFSNYCPSLFDLLMARRSIGFYYRRFSIIRRLNGFPIAQARTILRRRARVILFTFYLHRHRISCLGLITVHRMLL